ncbi:MAG TPA: polysaccharide deacetylase family protein [Terriglobales bacterium]|nr:polysaccharide deacetylase family protein [Terriglobales bacterium]
MSLRSQLGDARRQLLCSLHSRLVPLAGGPIVSFGFDDFPRSAYMAGGEILKSFGARGTYYISLGLMNTSNDLGEQFRLDDLHSLVKDGHELASHTFSHLSSRRVSLSAFLEDARRGRNELRNINGGADSANFAYPYGDITLAAKKSLGSEMASCRGTTGGLNGPEVDLNLLRANSLYGDIDQFERVQKLILQNEKQSSWLIFYTHDVRPNPSRFGCTPALFEAAVSFAAGRGSRMMTVAEVLKSTTRITTDRLVPVSV